MPQTKSTAPSKPLARAAPGEVISSIVGVELDMTLAQARSKLASLSDPARPPKQDHENEGRGTEQKTSGA